jgi:hypothetical protein
MERSDGVTRREFLAGAASFAALARTADAVTTTRLRLGGPIYLKSEDPAKMAREHRRLGYRAAYVPPVTTDDHEKIVAITKAFAAEPSSAWK